MSGFPGPEVHDILDKIWGRHEPGIAPLHYPPNPPTSTTMAQSIRYIPPQMDSAAGLSTSAARQSPIRLMLQDARVLINNLRYLPGIVLPFKTKKKSDELYLNISGTAEIILQGSLFVIETVLLLLTFPFFLTLPGGVWAAGLGVCYLAIYFLCMPIEGPAVLYSNMSKTTQALAESHKDERWLFVNGCMVGSSGLQKAIDRIAATFGRAVIGVHNKTWGLPADLIECLIQRAFAYRTTDVRVAYSYIKATLVDPTVRKVVLIGHSQGGTIVSLVIDQLLTELPTECISKLEVYTFGSAASHFSNPLVSLSSRPDSHQPPHPPTKTQLDRLSLSQPKHLISHIEHYANELDMVPRWGVLHCTRDILNNRYAGSVFVREGASGHMFNQHYMDAMFPFPEKSTHWLQDTFLDRVIQVDEDLAMKREKTAVSKAGLLESRSGLDFGDGEIVPETRSLYNGTNSGLVSNGDLVLTFARTDSGRLQVEEARGKTVRELSRLWRYHAGRSPDQYHSSDLRSNRRA